MPADDKKITKAVNQVLKILERADFNIAELILFTGNMTYFIGASIAGYQDKGPNIEELKREYYSSPGGPGIDIALMLSGLTTTSWLEDWEQHHKLSSAAIAHRAKKESE